MAQEYEQPWNVSISVPKGRKLVVGCGFYRNWNDYERSIAIWTAPPADAGGIGSGYLLGWNNKNSNESVMLCEPNTECSKELPAGDDRQLWIVSEFKFAGNDTHKPWKKGFWKADVPLNSTISQFPLTLLQHANKETHATTEKIGFIKFQLA